MTNAEKLIKMHEALKRMILNSEHSFDDEQDFEISKLLKERIYTLHEVNQLVVGLLFD